MQQQSNDRDFLQQLVTELIQLYGVSVKREDCLQALYALPDFLQDTIHFHFYLDYKPARIAAALNIAESLVQRRICMSTTLIKILYAAKPKNPV